MSETFQMLLCNATESDVQWDVTPEGGETIPVTQAFLQFGSIEVSFAPSYLICANGKSATAQSPSISAVYDGKKVLLLAPAALFVEAKGDHHAS